MGAERRGASWERRGPADREVHRSARLREARPGERRAERLGGADRFRQRRSISRPGIGKGASEIGTPALQGGDGGGLCFAAQAPLVLCRRQRGLQLLASSPPVSPGEPLPLACRLGQVEVQQRLAAQTEPGRHADAQVRFGARHHGGEQFADSQDQLLAQPLARFLPDPGEEGTATPLAQLRRQGGAALIEPLLVVYDPPAEQRQILGGTLTRLGGEPRPVELGLHIHQLGLDACRGLAALRARRPARSSASSRWV